MAEKEKERAKVKTGRRKLYRGETCNWEGRMKAAVKGKTKATVVGEGEEQRGQRYESPSDKNNGCCESLRAKSSPVGLKLLISERILLTRLARL